MIYNNFGTYVYKFFCGLFVFYCNFFCKKNLKYFVYCPLKLNTYRRSAFHLHRIIDVAAIAFDESSLITYNFKIVPLINYFLVIL